MWYSPSHGTTNTVILVLDYNTVSNIISLYIFEILINVASHSCINQSMYKMSTVNIQTGHPSACWNWAFKVELRSFQGCVFSYNILGHIMTCVLSLSPNYLSDTYFANKYFAQADVSHCCTLIKKLIFSDFFCYFDLEMTLM